MAYDHEKLRDYILGNAGEKEAEEFAEMVICDPDFADELAAVEAELLDDFVNGELSEELREKVRIRYSATEYRRRKLAFAAALRERAAATQEVEANIPATDERTVPWWSAWARPIWATAVVMILTIAGAVIWQLRTGDNRIATSDGNTPLPTASPVDSQETPAATSSPATVNRPVTLTPTPAPTSETNRSRSPEPASSPKPLLATFVLRPSMRGEGAVQSLPVAADTREFAFRLMLEPNDFETFEVTLTDQTGETKFWTGTRPKNGSVLTVSVRSELPRDQLLVLSVRGVRGGKSEPFGTYNFRLGNR